MRLMYDCTHVNVAAVKQVFKAGNLVGLYVTGSPEIKATPADEAAFPPFSVVTIDQGFTGSPVANAMVRDVESGAWTPARAVNRTGWTAIRPTQYCNRSTLPALINEGWRGDVWLAWPGWTNEALPSHPGINIVAVQSGNHPKYDTSAVLDPTWPFIKKPPLATVIGRYVNITIYDIADADHYVIQYNGNTMGRGYPTAGVTQININNLHIPDSRGGTIEIYAIVHSMPILLGNIALP